jgi:hypothetical protein
MTKKEQKKFIKELINNVEKDILKKADQFPETWDGRELRIFIAEQFDNCIIKRIMSKSQLKEYKNFVLINNL